MAELSIPNSAIRIPQSKNSLFLGIFLTSAAALTLELSIIRLLSVAQWHHFAFLAGQYGAPGVWSERVVFILFPLPPEGRAAGPVNPNQRSRRSSALLAYLAGNSIPFDLARISFDRWQILYLFLFYLVFSVPFFFSRRVISSALTHWNAMAGKLYFSDLAGASLGCLLALGLFGILGGPGTLLFACLLGGVASAVFGRMKDPRTIFPWMWTGFLVLLLFWQPSWMDLRLSPYKSLSAALRFPGARLLETHWQLLFPGWMSWRARQPGPPPA